MCLWTFFFLQYLKWPLEKSQHSYIGIMGTSSFNISMEVPGFAHCLWFLASDALTLQVNVGKTEARLSLASAVGAGGKRRRR